MSATMTVRFVVTSVSGYGGEGGNGDHFATFWQVLDSAYCYRLVWEFSGPRAQERAWRCRRCAFCRAAHALDQVRYHSPITRPGRK
jgi:hypothetical protein